MNRSYKLVNQTTTATEFVTNSKLTDVQTQQHVTTTLTLPTTMVLVTSFLVQVVLALSLVTTTLPQLLTTDHVTTSLV